MWAMCDKLEQIYEGLLLSASRTALWNGGIYAMEGGEHD
jgi:hypothetical protein